jgi:hypothetical protein
MGVKISLLSSEEKTCLGCLTTGAERNIWTWAGGTGIGLVKTAYEILVEMEHKLEIMNTKLN